jgi:hypothetical protein
MIKTAINIPAFALARYDRKVGVDGFIAQETEIENEVQMDGPMTKKGLMPEPAKLDRVMLAHARYSLNMKRVAGLMTLATSNEGQFKPTGFMTYEGISADLFRMIVVFLHATVEELVRGQLRPNTKFTFSSGNDIDKALRKAGFNPDPLQALYPPLTMMARRRIAIVHRADLREQAEDVDAWSVADLWSLGQWNLAVIAFLYRLLSIAIGPHELLTQRYEAALKAMHENVAYGRMILALPSALRAATTTLDSTDATKMLEAMQDKLSAIQQLIRFQDA